jgi:type I restriction enzyme S subunit
MPNKWKIESLREAGVSLIDCDHRTPPAASAGYPYVAIPQLKQGRIDLTDVRRVTREHFVEWTRKANPKAHDVILSRRCNPGETAVVPDGLECALGQNLVLLRADERKMFPPFLRWLVRGSDWWEQIGKFLNVGAVFDSLKCADIPNFRLPIPPPDEQRAIANVLGTLDDKIELNRRMNETLEALAESLFKSWFADAAASKPKGWSEISIAELCEINSWMLGKNDELDRIGYVEISEVQRGNIATIQLYERGDEPSRARRRLRHGDTVLSTVRPDRGAYFLCLNPPPSLIASTGFAVLSPTKAPWSFIHAAMTQPEVFEYLGQHADGGAYPAVRPELIGKMTVPWPKQTELLESFHDVCAPLYERAEHNRLESRTLAELRDALLPKLLSGELRVPGVHTEEASK